LRGGRFLVVVLPLLWLSACATPAQQVDQARQFASAGVAFCNALPPLYDAYWLQSVQADSLDLIHQQDVLKKTTNPESAKLRDYLDKSNEDLKQILDILRLLKAHAGLLRSYFAALNDLASEDVDTEVPPAARQAVDDLKKIGLDISGKKVLGTDVGSLVETVTSIAVTGAQAQILKSELEARAQIIDRELAIHEEIIGLIAEKMAADRQHILILTVQNALRRAYVDPSASLPSDWWRQRADYLSQVITIAEASRAEDAARNLRVAWSALASGGNPATSMAAVKQDVAAVMDVLRKFGLVSSAP
jgi:hypothetical protein